MNIKINDIEIELKNSFKSYIAYEDVTGESFAPTGLKNIITLFYCMAMTSNYDLALTFDEFLEWLDANPDQLTNFTNFLVEKNKRNDALSKPAEEKQPAETDKKK